MMLATVVIPQGLTLRNLGGGSYCNHLQWSRKQLRVAGATDTGCGCGFDY